MFKKSSNPPEPPHVMEIQPRGKGMPSQPPQARARSGGSTDGVLAEIKPKGK